MGLFKRERRGCIAFGPFRSRVLAVSACIERASDRRDPNAAIDRNGFGELEDTVAEIA